MKSNLVEVNFDSVLELEYLNTINQQLSGNPSSIESESLTYDEHHVLLVAAYVAKDFLIAIHFPEKMKDSPENLEIMFEFWENFIGENTIMPSHAGFLDGGVERKEPTDFYLQELLEEIEFKGYIHLSLNFSFFFI